MTYSNPAAVSRDPTALDQISISLDKKFFSDPATDLEINGGETLILNVPRQIDPAEAEEIASAMTTATNTANTFATGNIVVNIILGSSLKLLWGMVNTLQFVVFFTDLNVLIPANAIIALEFFRTIALGEFIDDEDMNTILPEPLQKGDDDSDESKGNVLSNMGMMLIIGGIILVLVVTVLLMILICRKN